MNVAYPLAPVGMNSVGGSEQILSLIDRQLVASGHRSIVIAQQGSETAGELIPIPAREGALNSSVLAEGQRQTRDAIRSELNHRHIDVVHLHGLDFSAYIPEQDVSVLATLHLPASWYDPGVFRLRRAKTALCCVSKSQLSTCPVSSAPMYCVPNGISVSNFLYTGQKSGYALMLTRVCPEKGVHIALEASQQAQVPLVIAGQVYGYAEHQRYFTEQVRPRLDETRRFVGPATFAQKRKLLAGACCLLVPSLVDETSSLVAMEAMASGTPVIAHRRGALAELVLDGETGFLVDTVPQMAAAIRDIGSISSARCRTEAIQRFPAEKCFETYLSLYRNLAAASQAA
ncbi:MAG: glycosyltransferase [Bryobacterales bacterium]|nr:glycosyltransferase [Bryobacterales bacterium]